MRSNDAPPSLEVDADTVHWGWSTHATGPGHHDIAGTVPAGFSHVSIRTGYLMLSYERHQSAAAYVSVDELLEAVINTVCYAPPTVRTCTLGCWIRGADDAGELDCWGLELSSDNIDVRQRYKSASKLAQALQPHATVARLGLQVNSQRDEVRLTRVPAASTDAAAGLEDIYISPDCGLEPGQSLSSGCCVM